MFPNLSLVFGNSVTACSYDQVSPLTLHLIFFYPDVLFDLYVFVPLALLPKEMVVLRFCVILHVVKHFRVNNVLSCITKIFFV